MNKNFDLKVLSDRNEKRLSLEQRTAYGMPIKMFLKRKKMDLIFDETDYSDNASMIKFNLIPTTDEADLDSYSKQLDSLSTTYRGMTKEVYPDKISITIPKASDDRQVLTLKRVLESEDYDEFIRQQEIKDEKLKRDGLYFVLGETVDNQMIIKDLKKCVHLLIAGTTGSGKSVCLHTIIDSLMYQYTPNQLKFVMFDMKAVELSFYDDSPYLLEPICIKSTEACKILENLTNEMNKRYNLIHSYGEKTIEGYNSLSNTDKLPYIVLVIDEYADLILTNKLVDEKIQELAQKSRACGIHLIISTQHPKADVVTSVIKACLTTRISFRVADGNASRMILDEGGAEDLSENGDMLIKTANEVIRLQCAFISEKEISELVEETIKKFGCNHHKKVKEENTTPNIPQVIYTPKLREGETKDGKVVLEDNLLLACIHVINEKKASRIMIKNFLKVGDSKADTCLSKMTRYNVIEDKYNDSEKGFKAKMTCDDLKNNFISVSEANA